MSQIVDACATWAHALKNGRYDHPMLQEYFGERGAEYFSHIARHVDVPVAIDTPLGITVMSLVSGVVTSPTDRDGLAEVMVPLQRVLDYLRDLHAKAPLPPIPDGVEFVPNTERCEARFRDGYPTGEQLEAWRERQRTTGVQQTLRESAEQRQLEEGRLAYERAARSHEGRDAIVKAAVGACEYGRATAARRNFLKGVFEADQAATEEAELERQLLETSRPPASGPAAELARALDAPTEHTAAALWQLGVAAGVVEGPQPKRKPDVLAKLRA